MLSDNQNVVSVNEFADLQTENDQLEDENKDFDITSLFSLFNFSETEEKNNLPIDKQKSDE